MLAHIHRTEAKADFDHAVQLDPTLKSKVPSVQGDVNRIDQAFKSVQALGPLTRMNELPPQEKARAMMTLLSMGGFKKVLEDLEYLQANLPQDDPRVKGVPIMLELVRNVVAKNPGA